MKPSSGRPPAMPRALPSVGIAGHRVEELSGQRAHHRGEQDPARQPARGRRTVDPGREADRASPQPGRSGRARAAAQQGAADVAAGGQPHGRAARGEAGDGRDGEHPPPLVPERCGLLRPPQRGQPGQPALGRVADPAQDVRRGEHDQAPRVDPAGVQHELRQQSREPGEHEGQRAERGAVEDRAGHRDARERQAGGEQDGRDEDRRGRDGEGRQGRLVPGDPAAEDRLEPARLLLASGRAGDQCDAQQREQERGQEPELVLDHPTQAVDTLDVAVDRGQRAAGGDRLGIGVDLGRGVVEAGDGGGCPDHARGEGDHPDQDAAAVGAPDDPDHGAQLAPAGTARRVCGAHRAASASVSPVSWASRASP